MKKWMLMLIAACLCAGCSEPEEKSKSEQLGEEIADQMLAPIDDAREIKEKLNQRELPPME